MGRYSVLAYKWNDYDKWIESCTDYLREIYYDGFRTNCHAPEDKLRSYPRHCIEKDEYVGNKLFILPAIYPIASVDTIYCKPPAMPPARALPPLTDAGDSCPAWELERRKSITRRSEELREKILALAEKHRAIAMDIDKKISDKLANTHDPSANEEIISTANLTHPLNTFLRKEFSVSIDHISRIALVEFEFPDYKNEKLVTSYDVTHRRKTKYASESQKKKLVRNCLYSMVIRAAVIAASYNVWDLYDSVVVNVFQQWYDQATGQPRSGIIASLQAQVDYLLRLSLSQLDPEACFKHLKGISTPSIDKASPIRPIFVMNKKDDRIVAGRDVDSSLAPETNLAAMDWEDFEHLVSQLFEWEFAKRGIDVKVTRASRDRGVDAILFDPDPFRGGKYVLQAKRYTNTVDVSAVRDLYGTVINEGANRGILITTSRFGPDAYEFAKDKPISLVDGPNMLVMLQKHGKRYRIDLDEAREINASDD